MSKITPRDIDSIAQLFEAGEWNTLELQVGATEVFLSKRAGARPSWDRVGGPAPLLRSVATPLVPGPHGPAGSGATANRPDTAAPEEIHPSTPDGQVLVHAPSLGTFYRAPKPGDPPFVEVGQVVTADTELCLIEVMKLFTTLRAGINGTVTKVLASDGAMIELGQPLFLIDARE